jgi:hypothetical protein
VGNGYTIRFDNRICQIARKHIRAGLRRASVRVELRLDGSTAVRFRDRYLALDLSEDARERDFPGTSNPT